MGLSFASVQKTYKVFNEIKETVLPDLRIPSWPEDMLEWTEKEKCNPRQLVVYGYDKKSDDGWEEIYFFVEDPSEQLKAKFNELKKSVPNTSMQDPYHRNENLWIFGWF